MRVLLVADRRQDFVSHLVKALGEASYAVDVAERPEEGRLMASEFDFDVCLVDMAAPAPRQSLARFIRGKKASLLVLAMTAEGSTARVEALEGGADDAISRPFFFTELLARVKTLLRRAPTEAELIRSVGDLQLDLLDRVVVRGGHHLQLTNKEFAILEYLMRRPGRVATRDMIIDNVWGLSFKGGTNVVDVYISYLRGKIDNSFPQKLIHTVRGAGYTIRDVLSGVEHSD